MNENLDELLEQLKDDDVLENAVPIPQKEKIDINDENINEWILQKAGTLIENGMDAVDALKQVILSSGEPHDISAYSEMFKAVVGALDTVGKINLQNKKVVAAKELKQMDIKAKAELPEAKVGNTNILIATREDIMKNFLEAGKDSIDVEFEEEDGDEDE